MYTYEYDRDRNNVFLVADEFKKVLHFQYFVI